MKHRILALLLTLCLCLSLVPAATAAGETFETSVDLDALVAHASQLYMTLEGHYDSVTARDSNACSIGFMQWHGMNALRLLKMICAADPAFSHDTLGDALYNEILTKEVVYNDVTGWKSRVLTSDEAACVKILISSPVGIQCQDELARIFILDQSKNGWTKYGVRTEAALIYYCSVENQYGVGNARYFMSYVRGTLGLQDGETINSLYEFHNAVLEASKTYSSIYNYLNARKKVYNFLVNNLGLDQGPDANDTPFVDMPGSGHWARKAISWAYNHEPPITTGTTATTFSPDATVTRGEAVTFLWIAAGKPSPETKSNPFTDVDADDYYYRAVLWAVENGITTGTTPTTFSPKKAVKRCDMLTLLWAAAGRKTVSGVSNPYRDVSSKKYYYKAVLWALQNGMLVGNEGGSDASLLNPKAACSRAYVVTYLYNLYGND